MISGSILLYHNGNQRVIDQFRKQFRYHKFCGNWKNWMSQPSDHCLYEICIADATDKNLNKAREIGIRIFRYISEYDDDQSNTVSELVLQPYHDWLSNVVCKNLCFADVIVSENLIRDQEINQHSIIITTGRTANTHLQMVDCDADLIECNKFIDINLLRARHAILLWRLDQWQCLTSSWILQNSGMVTHQFQGKIKNPVRKCDNLTEQWINVDWKNLCQEVLDQALFFHYVVKRTIYHMTTEDVIKRFTSRSEKINYDKSSIIPNYKEMENFYFNSETKKIITMCYNNTLTHII